MNGRLMKRLILHRTTCVWSIMLRRNSEVFIRGNVPKKEKNKSRGGGGLSCIG